MIVTAKPFYIDNAGVPEYGVQGRTTSQVVMKALRQPKNPILAGASHEYEYIDATRSREKWPTRRPRA